MGLTYLFIAHNLAVVEHISDRVGVMYLGRMVEMADVDELYQNPRHPYTVALLSAIPNPNPRIRKKRLVLKGDIPSPAAPPSGCRFHTRCWLRERLGNPERCVTEDPEFRDIGATDGGIHTVACHFAEEIGSEVKLAIGLEPTAPRPMPAPSGVVAPPPAPPVAPQQPPSLPGA
jgi:oligopeptide/dipeptide ABC transporter ATP-binding protein